jgi:hypothetical protein
MTLTMTKLITHQKKIKVNPILQWRMKPCKFWNENVNVKILKDK